jgi:thiol-disulfide isomerase/thioredoxin
MTQALRKARKRRRPGRGLEVVLWAITGVLFLYRIAPEMRSAAGLPAREALAAAVDFEMIDGRSLSLQQLRGQVVLVNFWATWCPPCRKEVGGFQKVYETRRAQGFTVIGLTAADESPRTIEAFRAERKLNYPVGLATARTEAAFGG